MGGDRPDGQAFGPDGSPVGRVPAQPSLRTLAVWAAVCLLILVAGAGAGYGLSVIQDPVYGAQAEILYRVADGSDARAERDLATQEVVLQGRAVLEPVAQEAGLPVEEVQDFLSVEVVGQSDVLRIMVEHNDPELALDLARSISDRYVTTVAGDFSGAREEAAGGGSQVRVLTEAYLLEEPLAPRPMRAAVAGGIGALVVITALGGLLARRWGYV